MELTEYGVLVVETGSGPRTESPTNAQLFCAFYYPPLFNISGKPICYFLVYPPFTEDPSSAPDVPLASILDLKQSDSCQGDLSSVEGRWKSQTVWKRFSLAMMMMILWQ